MCRYVLLLPLRQLFFPPPQVFSDFRVFGIFSGSHVPLGLPPPFLPCPGKPLRPVASSLNILAWYSMKLSTPPPLLLLPPLQRNLVTHFWIFFPFSPVFPVIGIDFSSSQACKKPFLLPFARFFNPCWSPDSDSTLSRLSKYPNHWMIHIFPNPFFLASVGPPLC